MNSSLNPNIDPAMPIMSLARPWPSVLPNEASGSHCDGLAAACAVGASPASRWVPADAVIDDGGMVKMIPPLPSDFARPLSTISRIICCADDTTLPSS